MPFDWLQFLTQHSVEYRDHGPNTGAGNIVVQCPMCGHSDPGMHMSISIEGKGWHCWRDQSHAGISPTRLVAALLGIQWAEAAAITGTGKGNTNHEPPVPAYSLVDKVNSFLHTPPKQSPLDPDIAFPRGSKPLSAPTPQAIPYSLYMRGRGITDMAGLDRWDIRFANHDARFHGRILFGVRSMGRLVALTGRAIGSRMQPRYLAEGPVDQYLIWTDRMPPKADTLILTEGPFDALKVNLLGNADGIWSTCCMTSAFSTAQRSKLHALIPRFRRTIVLFDHGNEPNAFRLASGFPNRMSVAMLPPGVKDPAELDSLGFLAGEEDDHD